MDQASHDLALRCVTRRVSGTSQFNYKRDPHLPSPEVCDWLVGLEWSEPISEIRMKLEAGDDNVPAEQVLSDYSMARVAIGADHVAELFIQDDALVVLRADAQVRRFVSDIIGER